MVLVINSSSRRSSFVGKRIGNGITSNKNWWLAGFSSKNKGKEMREGKREKVAYKWKRRKSIGHGNIGDVCRNLILLA